MPDWIVRVAQLVPVEASCAPWIILACVCAGRAIWRDARDRRNGKGDE